MSFGDGPHKCPGATVAIQETAIFLGHLLAIPGLRLAKPPEMSWNTTTAGYVLRGAVLVVEG
jgi:cytochrome P450